MKIKCPFEPFEIAPDYTKGGLSLHLQEDHEVREVIADYFLNIIFKIHEKIESLQNRELVTADLVQNMTDDKLLQELKSLLEDKK